MMSKTTKGDILWGLCFLLWVLILVVPESRETFLRITDKFPYMGGFIKFFFLASMGDWLGMRIRRGAWVVPKWFLLKACNWGVLGIAITLVFTVYMGGTAAAQSSGRLPFLGSSIAQAFFGSVIMNLTFGPMLYIYHKFGDLYIDMRFERGRGKIHIRELVDRVDWYTLVEFSWLKTCIFIWIPFHTIVFLLPSEYRVLASAFLSILLGVLVAFSSRKEKKVAQRDS